MPSIVSGVTGLIGAGEQASATKTAAADQLQAATQATNLQQNEFNTTQANEAPWLQAGTSALGSLSSLTAPGGSLYSAPSYTSPGQFSFNPGDLTKDPGYQFTLGQGEQGVLRNAAATGTLGGTSGEALSNYAEGLAGTTYNNAYSRALSTFGANSGQDLQDYNVAQNQQGTQFNRLSSLAGLGQTAVAGLNSAGTNFANNASNIAVGSGNAQAASAIAGGNAAASGAASIGQIGSGTLSGLTPNPYTGQSPFAQLLGIGSTTGNGSSFGGGSGEAYQSSGLPIGTTQGANEGSGE
jgi:hypothetical protein